jgi:hypothetical protein
MKYLILIYSNPMSRELWAGFSPAEQAEGFKYYAALTDDLAARGELIVAEALADAAMTRRVHVRDGQTLTTDGPFAEAKEQLMGIYLIQCDSPEHAIAIAAQIPEAEYGLVEVRPIQKLGGSDM